MYRRVSRRLETAALAVLATVGLAVSLGTDLGLPGSWLAAVAVATATAAVVHHFEAGEALTVVAVAVVLLSGTTVFFAVEAVQANGQRAVPGRTASAALEKPREYKFVVFAGEPDPEGGGFAEDYAYPRVEPTFAARAVDGASLRIGERVRVACAVREREEGRWFKVSDGSFVTATTVKPAPHEQQGMPPWCPEP